MDHRRLLPYLAILASFAAIPVLKAENEKPQSATDVFDTQGTEKSTVKKLDAFQEAKELTRKQKIASTPRLMILTEFIEIEQTELTRWLADPKNQTDGPALRKHVQALLRDGKATLRDMNLSATRSGARVQSESIDFHIYPTEWQAPETGEESGDTIVPAGYGACECRNVGFTTEADAVLGPHGRIVDLNLSPEIVELVGETVFGKQESEVKLIKFHTMKAYSQIIVPAGEYGLVGTTQPDAPADPKRKNPVVLVFARADVHQPPRRASKADASKD